MRVAEVMTASVQTVPPNMTAVDAWDIMRRRGIHHLVVMAGSEVLGVLSDRDAGGRNGAVLRGRSTVSDLMSTAVVTVEPGTTIRRVASMMRGRTIGCVPVIDGHRLVGIVTVSDLLALLGHGRDRPSKRERPVLNHRVPHRKQATASGMW